MKQKYRYTYAVARIRYLERELLSMPFFYRLIEAESMDDLKKILDETVYGLKEVDSFDVIWENEDKRVSNLIRELMPDMRLKHFFGYKYDLFNLKILFKNRLLSKRKMAKNWDILVDMGSVPLKRLVSVVENEAYVYLPFYRGEIASLINQLVAMMDKASLDTRFIDIMWDKIYFKFLLQEAFAIREPFLAKYVRTLIDLTNILTFFRLRKTEEEKRYLTDSLIDGGFVDIDKFVSNYQDNLDSIAKALAYSPYGRLIGDMVSSFEDKGNLALLERIIDNYLVAFISDCRYVMFGIEPLIAFSVAKEMEVKNLRIIITGKQANLSAELLKGRLRNVYA